MFAPCWTVSKYWLLQKLSGPLLYISYDSVPYSFYNTYCLVKYGTQGQNIIHMDGTC